MTVHANQSHDDLVRYIALQLLIRQTNAILHTNLITDTTLLAQDGDTLYFDPVLDDRRAVAGHRCGRAFNARPGSNTTIPPDDRVQDTGVVFDLRLIQHDGFLDAHARADDGLRADGDVGAEFRGRVDLRGGVDEDRWHDSRGGFCDLCRLRLERLGQVECVGGHSGASGLDLPPEVLGLVHKEAVAVGQFGQNILLEAHDFVALAVFVIVGHEAGLEVLGRWVVDHAGPFGLALDGSLDAGEDGIRGEEVDAAVDEVGDVGFGLFNIVEHAFCVGVGDDAAEVGGCFVGHAGS